MSAARSSCRNPGAYPTEIYDRGRRLDIGRVHAGSQFCIRCGRNAPGAGETSPARAPFLARTGEAKNIPPKRASYCARRIDRSDGAPGRIRTCDQEIRRLLLYPLSYGGAQLSTIPQQISALARTSPPEQPECRPRTTTTSEAPGRLHPCQIPPTALSGSTVR